MICMVLEGRGFFGKRCCQSNADVVVKCDGKTETDFFFFFFQRTKNHVQKKCEPGDFDFLTIGLVRGQSFVRRTIRTYELTES